ncbi:ABC transporter substrate-binding protein [Acinetobacter qingfengensis]|uniref:Amino acid ABC transporter substrate-binding protein n=1 Tax=Acinetobacter qingfengensis TaxID=1262585 RepID=A0A1E7RF49_9GAMM|nr:ABC transporter substrate-binding protein [Acinetobacter qingfengensis]KAA8735687.1 ABC transporter substrate-binding protein [Acinetobacter qingfengensis]OEY97867.1 amino acid ABC transporter substrate-binding protein [Acinetobacter qingfengensis]
MRIVKSYLHPLLAFMLAAGLTACNKESASTENASSSGNTAETINIGSDMTFPPFEYMENNQPAGFDIDLMNAILKQSSATANFMDTRFSNLIPGLDGKKYDAVISGMYITQERLKKVDMIPYFKSTESVVVLTDSSYKPKVRDDLCGKTIATQKGSLYPDQLNQLSKESCLAKGKTAITVREFDTSPQAVQAVLAKAADAQYDDSSVARTTVKKLNGKVEITSTEPFFPFLGGIAVRKGDTTTYNRINEGLQKLKQSGEYDALIKKYDLQAPTEEEIKKLMN